MHIMNNKAETDSGWRGTVMRHARWSMDLIVSGQQQTGLYERVLHNDTSL
jgi:hypothetical protein